jgi:sodium transport system permease protein
MFTICILPLLLYPLMGMVMLQIAQFHREQHVSIGVFGYEHWPQQTPLFSDLANENQIRWKQLAIDSDIEHTLSELKLEESKSSAPASQRAVENFVVDSRSAEKLLKQVESDVVIWVPREFSKAIHAAPIVILSNQRWERSQLAVRLLGERLDTWHRDWVRSQLTALPNGNNLVDPPAIHQIDVSLPEMKRALVWSKLLPFVMLVWALTGAFYPAIDLCAGEKERGTLETLLCSPARRKEIVWGKLLTVMCFSIGTALLNLASMHVTTSIVMTRFAGLGGNDMMTALGPLPLHSMSWLILLVIPIAAMFSALALAVASLARSTKEGQYYLMPLLLVGMPLVMLPMLPGVALSPGTSVVPITGAILLSRALMDGEYGHALLHLPTVIAVTVLCCLLAVRWAIRQFESESVMFRDGERASVAQWIVNVWRHREDEPSPNESLLCGLFILVCLFFGRLALGNVPLTWASVVQSTVAIQVGMILAPALIMAVMLTRSVRKAIRLHAPRPLDLLAVAALAFCLHPTYAAFASAVSNEYKLGEQTSALLLQFDSIISSTPLWSVILVLAIMPAICEELVFRGFVFAGLSRNGGHIRAILVTAFFFGLSHGVLQQTITASAMGVLLGWLAYRTGGSACTIVFHAVHNGISMTLAAHSSRGSNVTSWLSWAVEQQEGHLVYSSLWCTLSVGMAISLIAWIATRPAYAKDGAPHFPLTQLRNPWAGIRKG